MINEKIFGDFSRFGNKPVAIDSKNNQLSYNQLEAIGKDFGGCMRKRAVVMVFCSNTVGCLAGYLSFMNNGSVPLLVSEKTDETLARTLAETYEPSYYYIPSYMKTFASKGQVVYVCHDCVLIRSLYPHNERLNSALALLLTTSGSVGSPKLVRLSYENVLSNAKAICQYLEISDKDRPVTTLPMNYTYGLSVINSHVLKGAVILLTSDSVISGQFWQFFKEHKATSMAGVPYTYEMLSRIRFYKMELPSLRVMTQAGGKLPEELYRSFAALAKEKNIRFYVMYGQTEATARMAYLPYDKAVKKCPSIGIPIPGGKITVVDDEGNTIETCRSVGELVYEGSNVALGYAEKKEDLEKGDVFCGELHTGDMAYFDEERYFYICGRKKRFLKLYGNRVNLEESQSLIKSRFNADCVCVGTDEKMTIYVTDINILNEVKVYISNVTNININAFEAVYIPEIPKNEAGKIQYSVLTEKK